MKKLAILVAVVAAAGLVLCSAKYLNAEYIENICIVSAVVLLVLLRSLLLRMAWK